MTATNPHPAATSGDARATSQAIHRPVRPWPRALRRASTWLVGLVLAAALSALGYVVGRLHAWTEHRELKTQLHVAVQEHQKAFTAARTKHMAELSSLQATLQSSERQRERLAELLELYEGYRGLQRALDALDGRNFGLAQAYVREAQRTLSSLSEKVAGAGSLAAKLSRVDVGLAGDLTERRRPLSAALAELGALLSAQVEEGGHGEENERLPRDAAAR